jgi:hypothetical protein
MFLISACSQRSLARTLSLYSDACCASFKNHALGNHLSNPQSAEIRHPPNCGPKVALSIYDTLLAVLNVYAGLTEV